MALSTDSITGNTLLYNGPLLFRGGNVCNKNAASADYELYDGQDANGTPLAFLHLASGGNYNQWIGAPGVMCDIGLFLSFGGGPLKGAFYVSELDDIELGREYISEHPEFATAAHGKGG